MATTKKTTTTKTKKTSSAKKSNVANLADKLPKTPASLTISKGKMVIGGAVLALAAVLFFFRGLFIVATVNGIPITRLELIAELESQSGQQTLESLVTEKLILQEAATQNVTITQEELDAEIASLSENLESQGQTLEQALAFQGLTQEDLVKQIRIQKLLEKMLLADSAVTDEDVAAFLEENAESFPEDDPENMKEAARQQLTQQKLSEQLQPWLTELRENASVNFWTEL